VISPDEALQDAWEQKHCHEVELACDLCPESWVVKVRYGEDLSHEDTRCPVRGCNGYGTEI
jgi:hypothetical protein